MPALCDLPPLLTPAEVAKLMRTTINSLSQDRYLGRGVPFIKHGRSVLYDREEIVRYLEENRRQRTDDPRGAVVS